RRIPGSSSTTRTFVILAPASINVGPTARFCRYRASLWAAPYRACATRRPLYCRQVPSRKWDANGKSTAAARGTNDLDPSIVGFHDVERERETEPRSGDAFCFRGLHTMEFFEDPPLFFEGNSDAMIDNVNERFLRGAPHTHLDVSRPARVLHGVAQKIQNC